MNVKKIIHIDMDAFYASVEERDFPELKGKPVIVGGSPESRGVVSTANYVARKFGVHSAMATSLAKRLCPHGVFVYPRFDAYIKVSKEIHEIFHDYSDLVEPLSLDEAYIDVTENKIYSNSATKIAKEIKNRILEKTKLTASAGVSSNKFIAKVASGMNKPNGLTVVQPSEIEKFMEELPIGKFYGVGKVTEKRMKTLGIHRGIDLKKMNQVEIVHHFGKMGNFYYDIVRGKDNREVIPYRERKSIGAENTFSEDILELSNVELNFLDIAETLWKRIQKSQKFGRTLTLKVKYDNFDQITRSITGTEFIKTIEEVIHLGKDLLGYTEAGKRKIRLIGLTISNFHEETKKEDSQLRLF